MERLAIRVSLRHFVLMTLTPEGCQVHGESLIVSSLWKESETREETILRVSRNPQAKRWPSLKALTEEVGSVSRDQRFDFKEPDSEKVKRLSQKIDTLNQKISRLQEESWVNHSQVENNSPDLPLPRLEIEWTKEKYWYRYVYSLIYAHFTCIWDDGQGIIKVPLGTGTRESGHDPRIEERDIPIRDGLHAKWDSFHLGIPLFVRMGEKVFPVEGLAKDDWRVEERSFEKISKIGS